MDVNVSQDEINRLRPFVVGNPAYDNLGLRHWSPINDDPNYEIKKVLYFDENDNFNSRKKIIVKRTESPRDLPADAYSILFNFQGTGGKKSRKRRNKKSRKRRNKKSRKG